MRHPCLLLSALALALLAAPAARSQGTNSCAGPEARQFDFWIGDWSVYQGDQLAGHNTIRPILDGCVLQESWRGQTGGAGTSLNFYDPQRGRWRQLWVWRSGTTLELEGEYRDGRMVLEGDSLDRQGNPVRNRITWSLNDDGSVRQIWQVATGADGDWQTAFDGQYRKGRPD